MKKNILIIFSLFLLFSKVEAQDVIFTRFNSNPLYTSSALTGAFDAKFRIGTSLRRQWLNVAKGAVYKTKSLYADMRLNIVKNDYFSIGIILLDDISGSEGIKLGVATGLLSLSYSKHLYQNKYSGQNQYLVFGIQGGYGKRYFDFGNYLFGVNFDKTAQKVIPDFPSGEQVLNSRLYLDINSGLMYYLTGRRYSFYIGGNIKHLNRANISLLEKGTSDIYMLYTMLTGGEFPISKNISILPSGILNLQGPFSSTIIGNSFRYQYLQEGDNAFRIGIWAIIPNSINGLTLGGLAFSTGLEFDNFEFGLNYDITLSDLGYTVGRQGAFELSLAYTWGDTPKNTPIICPKF